MNDSFRGKIAAAAAARVRNAEKYLTRRFDQAVGLVKSALSPCNAGPLNRYQGHCAPRPFSLVQTRSVWVWAEVRLTLIQPLTQQ